MVQAECAHTYLVRGFDEHDIPEMHEFRLAPGVAFDYAVARASAPALPLGPRIVRAELWTGDRWEEFYRSG